MKLACAFVAVALLALLPARLGTAAGTRAYLRCHTFTRPVLKYPSLYAIATFRCEAGARRASESVVLQGWVKGQWTTLESATRNVRAHRNTTYLVKTPAIPCSPHPHPEPVRSRLTLFAGALELKARSKVLQTSCLGS